MTTLPPTPARGFPQAGVRPAGDTWSQADEDRAIASDILAMQARQRDPWNPLAAMHQILREQRGAR